MKNHDVYLYGMIVRSTAFLLRGAYPQANMYGEIKEKHSFPGGETGTAGTVLASLGCKVKMDGNYTGYDTDAVIRSFYAGAGVDVSRLRLDPGYEGTEDYIIIDPHTRTILGKFASYFEDYYQRGIIRWNTPAEEDVKGAKAAGIDPFFDRQSALAARMCREHNVPFVTIDEKPGREVCRLASVVAVSGDYIRDFLPEYNSGEGKRRLLKEYGENTGALVILTDGGGTVLYGRKGEIREAPAFKVDVVSTLGAGDTFKAGCIYGLLRNLNDDDLVRYASACAAVACTKFPLPLHPPEPDEVERLFKR